MRTLIGTVGGVKPSCRNLTIAACLLVANAVHAQTGLPDYFSLPKPMVIANPERTVVEANASALFRLRDTNGTTKTVEQHGKRYFAALTMVPDLDQEPHEVWMAVKPMLIKSGWKIVTELDTVPVVATLRREVGGKQVWATFISRGSLESTIEIVEVTPAARPK
jgi:hypothetical protein